MRVLDLAGRTSLWQLGALLERAALVLCNDTGVSHVAAALKVPSVVISSGADVARWAPADAGLHRVQWAAAPCRPCAFRTCPHAGHPCATDVTVAAVHAAARAQLADARGVPAARHAASQASPPAAAPLRTPLPLLLPRTSASDAPA
jgi:ADP-heptose:LPS heptosyltransferase